MTWPRSPAWRAEGSVLHAPPLLPGSCACMAGPAAVFASRLGRSERPPGRTREPRLAPRQALDPGSVGVQHGDPLGRRSSLSKRTNAILLSPGDQAGGRSRRSCVPVSRTGERPLTFMTWISAFRFNRGSGSGVTLRANAIRRPSGDQFRSRNPRPDVRLRRLLPFVFTTRTFPSPMSVRAIRSPAELQSTSNSRRRGVRASRRGLPRPRS